MRIIASGLTAALILAAVIWTAPPRQAESNPSSFYSGSILSLAGGEGLYLENRHDKELEKLFSGLSDAGLPAGRVEKYEADNSWGWAVYIPQTHKNPASESADRINDSAEIAQKEIYELIGYLVNKEDIDFVMAEGDLYGEVPEEKINRLADKIRLRGELKTRVEKLKSFTDTDGNIAAKLKSLSAISKGEKALDFLDREIALAGAPYQMKAEGAEISLYGAENEDTREECAHLVRDYVYQEDRIKTLSAGGAAGSGLAALKNNSGNNKIVSLRNELLARLLGRSNKQNIDLIKSLSSSLFSFGEKGDTSVKGREMADGTEGASALIKDIDEIYDEIKMQNTNENKSGGSMPDRNDNPYNSIDCPDEMNKLHQETEKAIQEVVVEKRNRETAENFARALKDNNENTGILQFGAGHEDGLVQELISQGLSVVVLSPEEVEK